MRPKFSDRALVRSVRIQVKITPKLREQLGEIDVSRTVYDILREYYNGD